MSRDNDDGVWSLPKVVTLLMTDCFLERAERGAPFVSIPEATLVPAAVPPVRPFADECHIARYATGAVFISKHRTIGAADDGLCPGTP
jgi:hypothetical protein